MKIRRTRGLLLLSSIALIALSYYGWRLAQGHRPGVTPPPVEPINEAGLHEVLRQNKGRVVLLNFWATWCEPCREEFPELVKFFRDHKERGLTLVFFSMDERDQQEQVREFLKTNGVDFVSYIKGEGDFEALVNSIDREWIGAIPATFVFDKGGRRTGTLIGQQHYSSLEKAVKGLL